MIASACACAMHECAQLLILLYTRMQSNQLIFINFIIPMLIISCYYNIILYNRICVVEQQIWIRYNIIIIINISNCQLDKENVYIICTRPVAQSQLCMQILYRPYNSQDKQYSRFKHIQDVP